MTGVQTCALPISEKFLDIKCRLSGLVPDCAVLVATIRAIRMHGGADKKNTDHENMDTLQRGLPNLFRHCDNMTKVFHVPCVVAINAFPTDTEDEIAYLKKACGEHGIDTMISRAHEEDGAGAEELAKEVVRVCENESTDRNLTCAYKLDETIEEKITDIVTKVYHGKDAEFTSKAKKQAELLTRMDFGGLPVCIAKTQYSFSDNPKLLGAPDDFTVTVRDIRVSAGAGFLVAMTGDIMTMPGLPKEPAAERIDVDADGKITGLF